MIVHQDTGGNRLRAIICGPQGVKRDPHPFVRLTRLVRGAYDLPESPLCSTRTMLIG